MDRRIDGWIKPFLQKGHPKSSSFYLYRVHGIVQLYIGALDAATPVLWPLEVLEHCGAHGGDVSLDERDRACTVVDTQLAVRPPTGEQRQHN